MQQPVPPYSLSAEDGRTVVRLRGDWTIDRLTPGALALGDLPPPAQGVAAIHLGEVAALDAAGAWLVVRLALSWRAAGRATDLADATPEQLLLLERVAAAAPESLPAPRPRLYILDMLERMGETVVEGARHTLRQIGFFGLVLACAARTARSPRRLRLTSAVHHMEAVGINAVPIVGLLSFLIGMVMVFVSVQQLARFGAQIYTINMLEIAVYREMAPLLTAIIVAGRSGSAFTAQIGAMVVNEEVDAMRSMGLDPLEMLVLPRLLALLTMVPLLTFLADIVGIVGGGLMCWTFMDIAPAEFLERFRSLPWPWHFRVGLIKAPFYALVIGVIGCFEGFEVTGSSASVGERTTRSVVEAIFWIIVLNAFFAAFFSTLGY